MLLSQFYEINESLDALTSRIESTTACVLHNGLKDARWLNSYYVNRDNTKSIL